MSVGKLRLDFLVVALSLWRLHLSAAAWERSPLYSFSTFTNQSSPGLPVGCYFLPVLKVNMALLMYVLLSLHFFSVDLPEHVFQ